VCNVIWVVAGATRYAVPKSGKFVDDTCAVEVAAEAVAAVSCA